MANISILTGIQEYTLNETVVVRFNPTDLTFIERLFKTFDDLDKEQESYKNRVDAATGPEAVFDVARSMDAAMREKVNELFAQDICSDLIGTTNIYALADGLPIWANLLLAIMDEVDNSYAREQKATNPRVQKYLKKYKR